MPLGWKNLPGGEKEEGNMHIILISACEKRALKKTRAILDSFAIRTGSRSWATPITLEGMREIRTALKHVATRQTAVACYRNVGRSAMKLLWIVGSKQPFGPDGHYPSGTIRIRALSSNVPNWVSCAALLAESGGKGHDWGKTLQGFQTTLKSCVDGQRGDPAANGIRHEWVSMRLLQVVREGNSIEEAWARLSRPKEVAFLSLKKGMDNPCDVLDFIVATHHKLFSGKSRLPGRGRHIREPYLPVKPGGYLPDWWYKSLSKTLERLNAKCSTDAPVGYWRALATWSRAALILADHSVSQIGQDQQRQYDLPDMELFANTAKEPLKESAKRSDLKYRYNQPLAWHLREVAQAASRNAYRMATLRLPSLSSEAVERILEPADGRGRYAWQNRTAQALRDLRKQNAEPILVMNIAGTGAGKTRMNAKCACILGTEGRERFAVALNQRSLTLQTGEALSQQLGIGKDEIGIVIGDQITKQLHDVANAGQNDHEDEITYLSDADFTGDPIPDDLPGWLEDVVQDRPALKRILGAPIIVSTIDYLVDAGTLNRQGHHARAFLRLIDSDIILDEIDSYDPKAMVAILRLVQMVGLCGRNLICSSATLPFPLAQAVHDAYQSGVAMWAALHGREADFHSVIIDDAITPTISTPTFFEADYKKHVLDMLKETGKVIRRIPVLQTVSEQNEEAWLEAVLEAVQVMQKENSWPFGDTGKSISFGLVRVANIRTAYRAARWISDHLPMAKVATYHSQEFIIQRFLKEQRLDALLNRKNGDRHIIEDQEIADLVSQSRSYDIPFIVVATPVEEIGRDHDFDWAIIEPSSSQSIVQTAGRVNRHRDLQITRPNVAILQHNFRWARGFNICFQMPGLQTREGQYGRHDMAELLDWEALRDGLNAKLRFETNKHSFANLDDESIHVALSSPLKAISNLECKNVEWMTDDFYRRYPLRDQQIKDTWRLVEGEQGESVFQRLEITERYQADFKDRSIWIEEIEKRKNAWLCWSVQTLREKCQHYGVPVEKGLRFEIVNYDKGSKAPQIIYDASFGFYGDHQKD